MLLFEALHCFQQYFRPEVFYWGGGGGGSENDQLTGHFQSFFFLQYISITNSKTSKLNQ